MLLLELLPTKFNIHGWILPADIWCSHVIFYFLIPSIFIKWNSSVRESCHKYFSCDRILQGCHKNIKQSDLTQSGVVREVFPGEVTFGIIPSGSKGISRAKGWG